MERKVFCRRDSIFADTLSFYLRERSDGKTYIAEPVSMKPAEENGDFLVPSPTFILRPEEAQNLMDSLWDAGLRPSEGTGSAGAMAAMKNHLEDMRTLVFNPPSRT